MSKLCRALIDTITTPRIAAAADTMTSLDHRARASCMIKAPTIASRGDLQRCGLIPASRHVCSVLLPELLNLRLQFLTGNRGRDDHRFDREGNGIGVQNALWRVKLRKLCKRKKREQFRSRSKTHLHFNSTWMTSNGFLLAFSGR